MWLTVSGGVGMCCSADHWDALLVTDTNYYRVLNCHHDGHKSQTECICIKMKYKLLNCVNGESVAEDIHL